MRVLPLSVAVLCAAGCNHGGSAADGGNPDGGNPDGGPKLCMTTADCGSAMLVCDPQLLSCVAKCVSDDACAKNGGVCNLDDGTCRPPCDQTGDGGTDGYCPAFQKLCLPRTGHCVDKCVTDDDCVSIDPGRRCDEAAGRCIADVYGCTQDSDCNLGDLNSYCFEGGIQCRCVIVGNDAGFPGVCARRHASCESCTSDVQCGSGSTFDPQGACKPLDGGVDVCLFRHSGPCGCGYIDDGTGYCTPSSGSCAAPGCGSDKDCGNGTVCDTQTCHCESRCRWDFTQKELAQPGCPSGETCWVDSENLDPTSIYYGSGRCRAACTSDTDCNTATVTNPHGGPNLVCKGEELAGGGTSDKRCRANGCMDDLECPEQPDTSIYLGYCDRASLACRLDCRTGSDPTTQKAYQDCRSPYGCVPDGGENICALETCAQLGGAGIACSAGQYCCGEDKDNDGQPDPCPPDALLNDVKCYYAPSPPFCQTCMSDSDCTDLALPSWLQGACANHSHSPSCSPLPIACLGYNDPATMMPIGVCSPSTYNDPTTDALGRRKDSKGCPVNFSPTYLRYRTTQDGDDLCTADSDCNVGNDAGRCAADPTMLLMDGGHPKACLCTVGATSEQCPNTADGGTFSFCRFGNPGDTQACISTVACSAPTSYVFHDGGAMLNGCALQ